MYSTPILYIVFNRPIETALSFEVLRKIKPAKLYVAADGPREGNSSDAIRTKEVRDIIATLDWDCEIRTLYRDKNLGCGQAVQGALDWFFDEVQMGVILEDDIIPNDSFFDYAARMLEQFKDNRKILSINGCSLAYENHNYDYGLTRYFNMWGWATWKRSNELVKRTWPEYDLKIDFNENSSFLKSLRLPTVLPQMQWINLWKFIFTNTKEGKIDTWDYQWVYTGLKNQMYCIRPNLNMIDNIGFNENSTHTSKAPHIKFSNMTVHKLKIKGSDLHGKMTVDKVYEIRHVGEYWNNIIINREVFVRGVLISLKSRVKNLLSGKN